MTRHTLTARRLITPALTIDHPVITIEDGLIQSIESSYSDDEETILTSTFFDIHTHGAAGYDVMEGTSDALTCISRFLATHGVGQYLPTTVTAPVDTTLYSLEGMANMIEAPIDEGAAVPMGIHLEGPFISHAKRGVHPSSDIVPPSITLFDRFQQAAKGHIKLVTVAPEAPGALDLIRHAAEQGVRVSLGHTNASTSEALQGVSAGATSVTHLYNAMRPLDHREPGIVGVALDDQRLFAELICDGVHVAPELIRLWLKAKSADKAILVTDSMSATGMPDGTYTLGTIKVTVAEGRALSNGLLAGSMLTMDRAVANVQRYTGVSLAAAVGMASTIPMTFLGLDTQSVLGKPANFNLFNRRGELIKTFLYGRAV